MDIIKQKFHWVYVICVIFVVISVCAFAVKTSPALAANAFSLSNAQSVEVNAADDEEYQKIAQQVFDALAISVSENGSMSGEVTVPFSFNLNGDSIDGQATMTLEGTYDADQKTLKGKYTYNHSRVKKHTFASGNVAELNGTRNFENRSFTGVQDGSTITIDFGELGKVTYGDVSAASDTSDTETQNITDLPDIEYQPGVDSGARFTSIQGEVKMYPDGDPDNQSFAKGNLKIEPGMHIFTGEESSVIITFADLSTYKVPPNSEIVIKNFNSKSQLSLITGKLWGNIKKIASGDTIEVRTNEAVLGIKGTTFVVEEISGQTTLKMIEGTIEFTSSASGKSVTVNAGEIITANATGLGSSSTFDVEKETQLWESVGTESKSRSNTLYFVLAGVAVLVITLVVAVILILLKRSNRVAKS